MYGTESRKNNSAGRSDVNTKNNERLKGELSHVLHGGIVESIPVIPDHAYVWCGRR